MKKKSSTKRRSKQCQLYLVIGVYLDNYQRFAEEVEASSAAQAERIVRIARQNPLIIAGVITAPNLYMVEVVA